MMCFSMGIGLVAVGCEEDDEGDESITPVDTGSDSESDTGTGAAAPIDPRCDATTRVCIITGTLIDNEHWTADYKWLLRGGVFVGDDTNRTVLTIDPGTTIYGESSTLGMLVIRRNSQIIAIGTKEAPIVFTSANTPGTRARGDWGGLIINGRATINGCDEAPCEAAGEGGTGNYGGDNDADSSGVLKYVRVEFAGTQISPENELNGIAFQGVGAGTTVDYVQVHMNADDGIEFFGGTCSAKHLYLTGIGDDNLDWTDGWRGRVQYVVAQQYPDAGDQGIEADNNADNNTVTPVANPVISNVTLLGSGSDNSDIGMLLREGTRATIHNALVANFGDACLDIDNYTVTEAFMGRVKINNSIFACAKNFEEEGDEYVSETDTEPYMAATEVFTNGVGNRTVAPASIATVLSGVTSTGAALTGGAAPEGIPFFDAVTYVGGVTAADNWLAGWTTSAPN